MMSEAVERRKYQWFTEEDDAAIEYFRNRGDSYRSIAARFPGRTYIDIYQRYTKHIAPKVKGSK